MHRPSLVGLLALFLNLGVAQTAIGLSVSTAVGNGADTYLTNDANRGPELAHGEKVHLEIRQFPDTRLRIVYLRFDLTGVIGDLSGATITLEGTSITHDRPIAFYGLQESPLAGAGEAWEESTITYATASGLDPTSPLADFAFTSDTTSTAVASTIGSADGPITTAPNPALDAFLTADTNGLVTFIALLEPNVTGDEYFFFSAKEGGAAPTLNLPNATAIGPDSDGDGLDDAWEDLHFGNNDGIGTVAELALQAAPDDPDADNADNLAEFLAGTDPNDELDFPPTSQKFYVAVDGDDGNAGTLASPFASIARAQQAASAGTTIYFRGGTYPITTSQVAEYSSIFARVFLLDKSGTEGAPIRYWAYPGETPIFDLSAVTPPDYRVYTFHVTGDWLHFKGLTVTGVQVTITGHTQSICFDNQGDHNIYEQLVMRDNQAIGMWLGNGSNNLVLNCDAYRNWDYTSENGRGGNVDGFGYHGRAGSTGNVFRGCRAWFNSDDGFDCINAYEAVIFEDCWAFFNGYTPDFVSRGDGTGFKAGGYGAAGGPVPNPIPRHTTRRCLAVRNKANGIYANHHVGGCNWISNTAFQNGTNFNMLSTLADNDTDVDGYDHYLRNNLAFLPRGTNLSNLDQSNSDAAFNFFNLPVTISSDDFLASPTDTAQLVQFVSQPRKANGDLPDIDLLQLAPGSDLIDVGENIGFPFCGTAPDLGAFESDPASSSLLELWRKSHFGNPTNTSNGADSADTDGDGLTNLLEYALGSSPLTPNSSSAPTVSFDDDHLVFSFYRIADPDLTYIVQTSTDLQTWDDVWTSTGPANRTGFVEVTDTANNLTSPRRFIRLSVSY